MRRRVQGKLRYGSSVRSRELTPATITPPDAPAQAKVMGQDERPAGQLRGYGPTVMETDRMPRRSPAAPGRREQVTDRTPAQDREHSDPQGGTIGVRPGRPAWATSCASRPASSPRKTRERQIQIGFGEQCADALRMLPGRSDHLPAAAASSLQRLGPPWDKQPGRLSSVTGGIPRRLPDLVVIGSEQNVNQVSSRNPLTVATCAVFQKASCRPSRGHYAAPMTGRRKAQHPVIRPIEVGCFARRGASAIGIGFGCGPGPRTARWASSRLGRGPTVRRLAGQDRWTERRARQFLGLDSLAIPRHDQTSPSGCGQFVSAVTRATSLLVGEEFADPWGAQLVEDASCYRYRVRPKRHRRRLPQNSSRCNAKIQGFRGVIGPWLGAKFLASPLKTAIGEVILNSVGPPLRVGAAGTTINDLLTTRGQGKTHSGRRQTTRAIGQQRGNGTEPRDSCSGACT